MGPRVGRPNSPLQEELCQRSDRPCKAMATPGMGQSRCWVSPKAQQEAHTRSGELKGENQKHSDHGLKSLKARCSLLSLRLLFAFCCWLLAPALLDCGRQAGTDVQASIEPPHHTGGRGVGQAEQCPQALSGSSACLLQAFNSSLRASSPPPGPFTAVSAMRPVR